MLQGNNVKDHNWDVAIFQDLSSSPATMQASKTVDFWGCLPDHDIEQADAKQAYTQAKLSSPNETWVRLPREAWPKAWEGMRDPVCPLELALYGHPELGGFGSSIAKHILLLRDSCLYPNGDLVIGILNIRLYLQCM